MAIEKNEILFIIYIWFWYDGHLIEVLHSGRFVFYISDQEKKIHVYDLLYVDISILIFTGLSTHRFTK